MCKGGVALGRPAQLVVFFPPFADDSSWSRAREFNFLIFLSFLVSVHFPQKPSKSRMVARFWLWTSSLLFGQITGVVGQIAGVVGQITGAIHIPIRTNYGRYPQISDGLCSI